MGTFKKIGEHFSSIQVAEAQVRSQVSLCTLVVGNVTVRHVSVRLLRHFACKYQSTNDPYLFLSRYHNPDLLRRTSGRTRDPPNKQISFRYLVLLDRNVLVYYFGLQGVIRDKSTKCLFSNQNFCFIIFGNVFYSLSDLNVVNITQCHAVFSYVPTNCGHGHSSPSVCPLSGYFS